MLRCKSRQKQNSITNRHATTEDEVRAAAIPWYTKLPKFSPATAEVCKSLCKLTSVKQTRCGTECTKICRSRQTNSQKRHMHV